METKRVFWAIGAMAWACFISKIRRLFLEGAVTAAKRYYLHTVVCYVLLISAFSFSSSVYTIGHGTGEWTYWCPLNAFDIVNDQIVFRGSVNLPKHGAGGIDVAMDELTNTLFVSFENGEYGGGNIIEIVDAKTLQNTTRTISGVTNLTSIVFDAARRKLYATDRDTNLLHVLDWNPAQKTVSLEKTIPLENIDYACGLSINDDLLYVSEFYYAVNHQESMVYYSDVNCYRISDDFEFIETIPMGDKTVAIGHDPTGNVLYGGAYAYSGEYHHLIKNPLDDPNGLVQKNIGAGVIGIACDNTIVGRVFLTTYRNHGIEGKENYGSIEMWDTADWQAEPNTLPITEVAAIYDDLNTDGTNMANLSGIIVTETPKRPIQIVKTDNVETCISPESVDPNVVYTVGVSDPNGQTNLWIVDHLPREVDFVSASPADQNYGYDRQTHTYTWYLPSLTGYDPNDPNSIPGGDPNEYFTLTARVNGWAEPKSSFTNLVTAESAVSYGWTAVETDVCCWGGDVIYVDPQATGRNTGTSWEDAYRDLPHALARAAKDCGSEIWVAGGTYRPADTVVTDTFAIPAGVSVYAGFAGNETSRDQRDILKYKTTLSGFIALVPDGWGGYYETRNNIVVTMDGDGAMLDGFTVEKSGIYGIFGSGDDYSVMNCFVINNNQTGVYCENGDLIIQWCKISNNGWLGLRHRGSGYLLTVANCNIHDNQRDGILTDQSTSTILNSLIYQNGSSGDYYGIHIGNPSSSPTIRNNTIVQNVNEGIRFVGSHAPDIVNCIIYYNGGDSPLKGLNPDAVAYNCCIADCNEVNDNFNDAPGFAYTTEPNNLPVVGNYHLAWNSPCVDTGDSDEYTDEVDIDGEPRVYGTLVDRGADEAYSCNDDLSEDDIYNALDWNADGLVNLYEFNFFSRAWLSVSPTDSNYNSVCDLDSDLDVDLADLIIFVDDWAWVACWRTDLLEQQLQQPPTEPTPPVSPPAEPNTPPVEPPAEPPAEPNVVFKIQDANELQEITLNVGDSICLYLAKQTFEEDVFVIWLEVNISDPNLGWLDNTEYNPNDPNNSATAQILASPRDTFFDYYGPGYTQFEGIQFIAVSLGGVIQDGSLASFVYTATQPGDVLLTLVNYDDFIPARLEQIVIHQTEAGSYSSQMGTSGLNSLMEMDAAAQTENILSLLDDIDALIDAGGDDAEAWQEIKILLEQSLMETEDTVQIE